MSSASPSVDASSLSALMLDAAMTAAGVILDVYGRPVTASHKADGSPVTEADSAAEAMILGALADTGIPVLAEESAAAGNIPRLDGRFFVVDPLDGTKEFLKRNGEFTVNIALVEAGRATHGVVLAPATGLTFWGTPEGAFAGLWRDGAVTGTHAVRVDPDGPMRIVASRSHGHAALADLCRTFSVTEDVSVGSSLKFCLLARGDAQLYPRFTPTMEWDTAAGQAVLEAAGGSVLTIEGTPLSYGRSEHDFRNPFFVAAASRDLAEAAAAEMRRLLA